MGPAVLRGLALRCPAPRPPCPGRLCQVRRGPSHPDTPLLKEVFTRDKRSRFAH